MKKYTILGAIALVMLAFMAVPVMADAAPSTSATLSATGSITQTLSLTNSAQSFDFGAFKEGVNEKDSVGTLTVTSAFIPSWKVTAAMSDGYGYMRTGSGGATGPYLANKLQEYNYNAATPAWVDAHGLKFTGSSSTTMLESFQQTVLISDAPGSYSTVVTYTIAAA